MLGIEQLIGLPSNMLLFAILMAWTLVWKGLALWKAAQAGSKKWFIALLILNTLGILEIVYVFFVKTKKNDK
jgi:hypothetical protein